MTLTPSILREFAEVMRDLDLVRVQFGDTLLERASTPKEPELTQDVVRGLEQLLAPQVAATDPREEGDAYPDGKAPVFKLG